MPDGPRYALEKLDRAIFYLATGAGPIKARLRVACPELSWVDSSVLPDGIREEFDKIIRDLRKRGAKHGRDGAFEGTLYGMHRATAVQIAERLWRLRYSLESELAD